MKKAKACPACCDTVLAVAVKCRHCGSDIGGATAAIKDQFRIRPVFLVMGFIIVSWAAAFESSSAYAEDSPALVSGSTVELRCGSKVALTQKSAAGLYLKAVQLVMSSEQNSGDPRWNVPWSDVQQEYLEALASDYVRIAFERPLRIETHGGPISTRQILIRVSPHPQNWRSRYADHLSDSVFSTDENGKSVGYGLYSGVAGYRLYAVIADTAGGDLCHIPPRSELKRVLDRAGP